MLTERPGRIKRGSKPGVFRESPIKNEHLNLPRGLWSRLLPHRFKQGLVCGGGVWLLNPDFVFPEDIRGRANNLSHFLPNDVNCCPSDRFHKDTALTLKGNRSRGGQAIKPAKNGLFRMRGGQNEGFPQGGNVSYKRLSGCEVPIFPGFLIATFIRYHYPGRERLRW